MLTSPLLLALQTTSAASPAAPAAQSIAVQLAITIVSIVVVALVWGVLLKFLMPAIAKKPVEWAPAFTTGATIAVVNGLLGFVIGLILPILGLLMLPIGFLVAMFTINKTRDVPLGQSALITLVGTIIAFVVMVIVMIPLLIIIAALGIK
jgi:hypothetical protein